VEGPQAAEHIYEEELENVSKVKDPNRGRVSKEPYKLTPMPPTSTLDSLSF